MTLINSEQFWQELHSCKIKLEHFKQENVLLKYRLSEMVDNNEDHKFLQIAEYFQNELLIADDKLKKLFNKFDEFSAWLRKSENKKELPGEIITEYNKLMKDIFQFENKFMNLSKEFNEKMFENTRH
ncbi:MAG TPA: hypothetical protein VMU83_10635 [Hanamia sp.]|nr:hypothetical protein [Hanamia sp.]